jgi:mono/diheme cytochrome c family protein
VRPLAVAVALFAAVVAVVAGCGSVARTAAEEGSAANGKALFTGQGQCGGCHTLADAGTRSEIGPNLDAAFVSVRAQGFDESTIRDVVRGQIAYPTQNPAGLDEEGKPLQGMPANLLTGQAADDVAAYVASVAGLPVQGGKEAAPAATGGEAIFSQNCGSCHTLSAAGTSGSIGPNLDESQMDLAGIVRQVRNGGGAMPAFGDDLTDEQIQAVSTFVAENRGR